MHIATKSSKIDLSSENKTEELAKKISKKLKPKDVIYLHGEMGVGKTTFVRYMINEFQKKNKLQITEVTSPTFNILCEYDIKQIKINHYDLFRLKNKEEIKNLDLFNNISNTITFIEWPQIIDKKPDNLIELNFKYEENHQKRSVQIKGLSF